MKTFPFLFLFPLISQAPAASLIVNGSFEERTTPPAPTSNFSSGVPDSWVDLFEGNTYLVHESHAIVPGNSAVDGEISVGGQGNIFLNQTFTTINPGRLEVSWWASNEFLQANEDSNNFHETAVQFNRIDDSFIEWTGFVPHANETSYEWVNHTYTTTEIFAPGDYQISFFVGGRSMGDHLVVTQIPEATGLSFLGLAVIGTLARRRR